MTDAFNFAYIYCNYQENYSPASVIGHVNQQLLSTRTTRRNQVRDLYTRHGHRKAPLDLDEQTSLLSSLLEGVRTIIVIDALDEMTAESDCRMTVLHILRQEYTANRSAMSLLVTARPLPGFTQQLEASFKIEVRGREEDLRLYIMDCLDSFVWDTSTARKEICDKVIEKSEGM